MKNENYVFVAGNQFARILSVLPMNKEIFFTLHDTYEVSLGEEPEGWFCAKRIKLFEEINGVLAIGYMGGGHTVVYNDVYNELTRKETEDLIADYLEDYLLAEFVESMDKKDITLEITKENRDIINKSLEE